MELGYADEEVDATAADPRIAELLAIPRREPLLRIRQVIYAGSAPESFNIKNFAPTNLGAFMNPLDMNPGLYSIASSIDLITIWCLVLVGIGTALVAGVKRSSGYIAAFGWWAVVVLAGAGIAAAFS